MSRFLWDPIMECFPNTQAGLRTGVVRLLLPWELGATCPVPVGASRQVGNSFSPGAGPSVSCPRGTWPWTQQLVCPQLCQPGGSPRQVRCTRVPAVAAPRSMLCAPGNLKGAQSRAATSGFPLGCSRKREKSQSRGPVPCPPLAQPEGAAPSSPAAGADQPLRVGSQGRARCLWGRVRG